MQSQQRIQRTYRVALIPFTTDGEPIAVEVNLSYPLDEDLAEPNHEDLQAEAVDRLRRLARQGRATSIAGDQVTTEDVATSSWDVTAVRQTLVTVELDDEGKPVRRQR
jgi:hypothetical protein